MRGSCWLSPDCLPKQRLLYRSLNRQRFWELRKHSPLAESADEVLGAAAALAERIIVRGEDARGIALPTLSTSLPPDALSGLNAAVSLQRWWRARRTERDAARDEDAPVALADAAVPPAAAAAADLSRDAALLVAGQGAAFLQADTTSE
mgnify:CR=1 FL=1